MKIKYILVILVANAFLLFLAGCSSPLVYDSMWQDKPVTIDGKPNEWKIPLDFYDPKTKLGYTVSNDRSNIYFCIRATEDETQKGIIRSGLQIWIDTTGGKKRDIGIQFPMIQKKDASESASSGSSSKHAQLDEISVANHLRHQYSGEIKQMRLVGFKGVDNGLAALPNMYGINACINWDTNNILYCEVCIPFKTFYKSSLSSSDSNRDLGITFNVSVIPKSEGYEGGSEHGGGGGMGGGGMGGMHGGGGGGGHGGGHGGGGGASGPETLTVQTKFKLSLGTQKSY